MFDKRWFLQRAAPLAALLLVACATASAPAARQAPGEAMAVAANPHAVDAALEILRDGGSAVDAAIAAEAVLGLVEPQSSGIGGGGFMLFYDAQSERIGAYDGRERAPMGATPTMFLEANGRPMAFMDAQASGRSIGAPSLVAMLKLAHEDHGRLPWARLFEPAIRLAEEGFAISPRMARFIADSGVRGRTRADFAARAYFFDRQGNPWPAGHILRNPDYAATLRAIAQEGPRALQEGPIAEAIVAAAQRQPRAGSLTLADLRAVSPRRVDPVCGAFRIYRVCTMAPPSSANTVIEILGLYERARPNPEGAANADDWSAFMWASRLAYADRDHYMADDQFVQTPTQEMIAPAYLDQRSASINPARAPANVDPGMPAGPELFERWGRDTGGAPGTTHMTIIDPWGNAVALTATVESVFGAQRMAGGFFLNNQLTDFSFTPTLNGRPVANAVAPGKAPRSSMSPTIVTDRDGELVMLAGSAGGSSIIGYVARSMIGVLDWKQSPREALETGNVVARFAPARVEMQRLPAGIAEALTARGWVLQEMVGEDSGLHMIYVSPAGLDGAADPRREGVVGRLSPTPPDPQSPAR